VSFLSFICFVLCHKSSMNFKLMIIKFSDPFLFLIPIDTDSSYVKFVRYILIVSHRLHICCCIT
jgi:hypothetical protein